MGVQRSRSAADGFAECPTKRNPRVLLRAGSCIDTRVAEPWSSRSNEGHHAPADESRCLTRAVRNGPWLPAHPTYGLLLV